MQHGVCDDGGTWFFNNASMDLSFQLVNMGYDVWITNTRGTVFSNEHKKYKIQSKEFWDFTVHEIS